MSERLIALDTETTGLSFQNGDKLIEIGAVEIVDRRITGNTFQIYINPERDIPEDAVDIHGLTLDDVMELSGGRNFKKQAKSFLDFVAGDGLIIHNAAFDLEFLNGELLQAGFEALKNPVFDTLKMANMKFPQRRNNLDALCRRFSIANDHREFHGALLDSDLLAKVYIEMTLEQNRLGFAGAQISGGAAAVSKIEYTPLDASLVSRLSPISVSDDEVNQHNSFITKISEKSGNHFTWPENPKNQPSSQKKANIEFDVGF